MSLRDDLHGTVRYDIYNGGELWERCDVVSLQQHMRSKPIDFIALFLSVCIHIYTVYSGQPVTVAK